MNDITHEVLGERINDIKSDLQEIKSEMKEQRITMQSVLIQMASRSSDLKQNNEDVSDISDRMLLLERRPLPKSKIKTGAWITGLLGVVAGLVELLRKH